MYLSLPSSNYQRISRSLVFTSYPDPTITPNCIRQASPASFGKSQMLSKFQNILYTLNRCGLYLGTNLLSRYNNGRGEGEETTKVFSLKDEQLSLNNGGCVVETSLGLPSEQPLCNFLGNKNIYIQQGKEEDRSHLKSSQSVHFAGHLTSWPSCKTSRETH